MSDFEQEIKAYLFQYLDSKFGKGVVESVSNEGDIDLIGSGIISSLEFITLLSDIEQKFNIEIDFEEYDPSTYTTLSGLANIAAKGRKI